MYKQVDFFSITSRVEAGHCNSEFEARDARSYFLAYTDWLAVSDRTMTEAQKTYRQALRAIPEQSGFPTDIIWPSVPEGIHP